jgi:hypothetical protein
MSQRSWFEVRWRQLRNPPPPVLRAVLANLAVAVIAGVALLVYDILSDGSLMFVLSVIYVVGVIAIGSLLTYLWVELPTGASGVRRRSAWAGVLGLFAAVPIVYLVLVVLFQIVKPIVAPG